jgi:hypothetical protein
MTSTHRSAALAPMTEDKRPSFLSHNNCFDVRYSRLYEFRPLLIDSCSVRMIDIDRYKEFRDNDRKTNRIVRLHLEEHFTIVMFDYGRSAVGKGQGLAPLER